MFFKSYLIYIFFKFLWAGLFWGLVKVVCKLIGHISKDNIIIVNLFSFAFWIAFGLNFIMLCFKFYNYAFCWFGLLGMFVGLLLVRISLDFLFTNLFLLVYNKIAKLRLRKISNGKCKADEKN